MRLYEVAILHAKAYRVLKSNVARILESFQVSITQWTILNLLSQNTKIRTKDIAQEMGVEVPFVTHQLNLLQERKLITRVISKEDKRERSLQLTKEGEKTVEASLASVKKDLDTYFKGVSPQDMKGYLAVLEMLGSIPENKQPRVNGAV